MLDDICHSPKASRLTVPALFLKIGLIGFGGGAALIPVIDRELVQRRSLIHKEEYIKHTVIANITPGALPVKLGATCGRQIAGLSGSIAGAYAVMFPGVLLTILLVALFTQMGTRSIEYLHYASVGITAFIGFLLLEFIRKTIKTDHMALNLALCLFAFILTGGRELRALFAHIAGFPAGMPLFDISTIQLMRLTFFLIVLRVLATSEWVLIPGVLLGGAYAVLSGAWAAAMGWRNAEAWLLAAMLLLLALLLWRKRRAYTAAKWVIPGRFFFSAAAFLGIPLVLTLVCVAWMGESAITFIGRVCLSTLTSFGGGEAYVSVADGIFVQTGFVSPELYYTCIVPVANALPGPILVKIAGGIGYLFGAQRHAAAGWLLAASAALAATGVCSALAVFVLHVYDRIRASTFVLSLKLYILPVICGMLLSTICGMFGESLLIAAHSGISGNAMLLLLCGWVAALFLLSARRRVNDLFLLAGSALASLAGFLVFAAI